MRRSLAISVIHLVMVTGCNRTAPPPAKSEASQQPSSLPTHHPAIHVATVLLSHNMIHQVRPVYPTWARKQHLQGTVRYGARIGKDGRIQNLKLISGSPALAPYALAAVRQWRYRPILLNGDPVEVITTIDVNFTLQ